MPKVARVYVVKRSTVHGKGAFARRDIRKGETLDEYTGERITHSEASRRNGERNVYDAHTFLFTVSTRTVIDGGYGGNDTRFFNHSCEPNCETEIIRGRVFLQIGRAWWRGREWNW